MNWTTADQLPKPMKEVIVAHENGAVGTAMYVPKFYLPDEGLDEDSEAEFNEEDGEYYSPEGWYTEDRQDEYLYSVDSAVTHWMPLPTHPNITATPTGEDVGEHDLR
jgi:hypothetical protein